MLLAILEPKKADPSVQYPISGMGGEPYRSGRDLGCSFGCSGIASRKAEVVQFCKSVAITVKPQKE